MAVASLLVRASLTDHLILVKSFRLRLKHILAYATFGTYPVIGQIGKRCSRFDAIVGIAYCRIIDPTTYGTNIFLHNISEFKFMNITDKFEFRLFQNHSHITINTAQS